MIKIRDFVKNQIISVTCKTCSLNSKQAMKKQQQTQEGVTSFCCLRTFLHYIKSSGWNSKLYKIHTSFLYKVWVISNIQKTASRIVLQMKS